MSPPITIGLPVYNGGAFLAGCLECLQRQTFTDFRAIVLDNCSTDDTAAIAQAFANRDPRFVYLRQPEHVGAERNFQDALRASESPWFLWRADDDLSSDNYLEKLYALATSSPDCRLAVSSIVTCDLDGGNRKLSPAPEISDPTTIPGVLQTLIAYHPSWFYGLWDRREAERVVLPVGDHYSFLNASDDICIYSMVIARSVRWTKDAEFVQRIRRYAGQKRPKTKFSSAQLLDMRRQFRRELARARSLTPLTPALRAALIAFEPIFLHRRLPSLSKIARTRLREMISSAVSSSRANGNAGA